VTGIIYDGYSCTKGLPKGDCQEEEVTVCTTDEDSGMSKGEDVSEGQDDEDCKDNSEDENGFKLEKDEQHHMQEPEPISNWWDADSE
jgi:hypothetical protein